MQSAPTPTPLRRAGCAQLLWGGCLTCTKQRRCLQQEVTRFAEGLALAGMSPPSLTSTSPSRTALCKHQHTSQRPAAGAAPLEWVLLHTRGLVGTSFCPLPGRRSPLRIQVCPCKPCLGGPGDLEGSQSSTSPLILSTELPAITYPLPSVPIPPVPRRQLHELSTGLPSHAQTCSFGRISRTRK